MIDVCHVSKRYGGVQALENVTLHVSEGSVLGLLGQNGAGKTTLLNIMTGYLAATEGHVLISGHDPLLSPEEAKRNLGYLPEHPPLYDEMTVREDLSFVSRLRGVARAAVPAHVDEIMEKTGLQEMSRRVLSRLSKGYRQRTGVAQALCGDPKALILDEPTVGLDPKQITEIRALIRRLAEGRTIVFSSHILTEVQQLCDHVVILHQGRIKLDAPMDQMEKSDEVTLLCTIAAPEKRILPGLHGLKGIKRVNVQASGKADETTVSLSFLRQQAEPEKALFTLLSGLNLPILRLTRPQDSLEQVFLRAISEG
jgi:ABC-2 type transport system ATP-binding protein